MTVEAFNPQELKSFKDVETVYCAGCFHGIINRLIGEVIDKMGIREKTIGVNTQGCGSFISDYMNLDFVEAPPGLSPSVATGIKHVYPDRVLLTYQGDGDLLSFGISDLLHAASKGEKITVILINNLVMAQSGGQMSPTTLIGQVTDTTPYGRSVERSGKHMRIAEMVAKLPGSAYVSRVTVDIPERIEQARKALEDAISFQLEGKGFSFVEFLSLCPTFWYKTPTESRTWLQEKLLYQFPVGLIKRTSAK
jgi:2-oxoglutarate ferredoxin oxidoreductase subunit beta